VSQRKLRTQDFGHRVDCGLYLPTVGVSLDVHILRSGEAKDLLELLDGMVARFEAVRLN